MPISVCPVATVRAPISRVWGLLDEPSSYAQWWDAETLAIVPKGPAQPGQNIYARTRALGRWWKVHIAVERVDAAAHQIDLTTHLPFGITVYNHITCVPLDSEQCRVSFG